MAYIVLMLASGCSQHKLAAQVAAKQPPPQPNQEIHRTQLSIDRQNAKEEVPSPVQPKSDLAEAPPDLKPLSNSPINIQMSNDARTVYDTLGKLAGLTVILDPDFPARRISIQLSDATLRQALDVVSIEAKAFWKPVTQNIILVAPDQPLFRGTAQPCPRRASPALPTAALALTAL